MWENCVITKSGAELLGRLSGIELTCAKFGLSDVPTAALIMRTDVTAPMGKLEITDFKRNDGGFTVVIQADNKGVEEEYVIKQIGLYAKERDKGEEVLLAIVQDNVGDRVPAAADMPDFCLQFAMTVAISNEAEITAVIDSSVAVSREQAERIVKTIIEPIEKKTDEHIADANKHITAEDRVKWNGKADKSELDTHIGDNARHLTEAERADWNGKADKTELDTHIADNVRHITSAERTAWNGKAAGSHGHGAATQSANGLMSAADKKKL
ncbi:MAG: hypothetical protein NC394_10695, partial [Bacteroides sp.]|nr:hypothetical protein [Bacteroides sp.]